MEPHPWVAPHDAPRPSAEIEAWARSEARGATTAEDLRRAATLPRRRRFVVVGEAALEIALVAARFLADEITGP